LDEAGGEEHPLLGSEGWPASPEASTVNHVNPTDHHSCIWSFSVHGLRAFLPHGISRRPLPEGCRIKHAQYIAQHGQDLVEIRYWTRGLAKAGKPL
jgi:hypothetical protein